MGVSFEEEEEEKENLDPFLSTLYTDPASPLAYVGLSVFAREVQRQYGIPRAATKAWLQKQRVYTKQRPAPRRARSDPTYVTGMHELYQADLLDMAFVSEENKGVRFLLTVIDVLSRMAYVQPLKRKTPQEVQPAFEAVLKEAGATPQMLQTDHGKEFYNKTMRAWLEKKKIHHYSTYSVNKAAIVERFNRTLKQTIVNYMIHTRQTQYVNVLPEFVKAYNARRHRSIGMAPQDVSSWNQYQVFERLYGKAIKGQVRRQPPQFRVGDTVRLSIAKANIFQRTYFGRWTEAVYRVRRVVTTLGNPRYLVEELDGTPVEGRFYADELQKIVYDPNQEFMVEAVLKRRKRKVGRKIIPEVLVQWRGYPEKYNTWEPEKNLK